MKSGYKPRLGHRPGSRLRMVAIGAASLGSTAMVQAQAGPAAAVRELEPMVISVQRGPQPSFTAPAAISSVSRDDIERAGPLVNLSESLNRMPGIIALNRQNYAQDLQLSIRGFGSRSTFGIRGVRLIVDGIPATMPDGQGQASNVALGSAGRIEVLRGPLAQLYGNAAGGVVQVFTAPDAQQPTATFTGSAGRFGQQRIGAKFSTTEPGYGLTVDASHFQTDGFREHSAARRGQLNARWQKDFGSATNASVVLNVLDQPLSLDPLGLTAAQFAANPRSAPPPAYAQDTRKTVRQQQIGSVVEHRFSPATALTGRLYVGSRDLDNKLGIPLAAQTPPTAAGGIVQFERAFGGGGLQLAHRVALAAGRELKLTGGVEIDTMREDRRGTINNAGVQGALKRDERNTVRNTDAYAQAAYDLSRDWTATAGLRASRVRFRSADRFIAAGNPDDSGSLGYRAVNPVAGLSWRAAPTLNFYANAGRGFETPTFTELAYRPGGATGLNTALQASRSRHAEIGLKWQPQRNQRVELALFGIESDAEIVVDSNSGGRSTFKNAGRTRRSGIELGYTGALAEDWRATLALNVLRARFADAFVSGTGAAAAPVAAGNRLPGTPDRSLFAELRWAPKAAWGGFNAGVELVHTGRLYANDVNDESAASSTVFNLRAGLAQQAGGWRFNEWLRLDNIADRSYAGSVIVNEANRRYFEAALARSWTLGATASYAFR